jgi:hypothetical protein
MSNYSFINIDGANSTVRSVPYSFTGLIRIGKVNTSKRYSTVPKGAGDRGDEERTATINPLNDSSIWCYSEFSIKDAGVLLKTATPHPLPPLPPPPPPPQN